MQYFTYSLRVVIYLNPHEDQTRRLKRLCTVLATTTLSGRPSSNNGPWSTLVKIISGTLLVSAPASSCGYECVVVWCRICITRHLASITRSGRCQACPRSASSPTLSTTSTNVNLFTTSLTRSSAKSCRTRTTSAQVLLNYIIFFQ